MRTTSLAGHLRISQVVDPWMTVRMEMSKEILPLTLPQGVNVPRTGDDPRGRRRRDGEASGMTRGPARAALAVLMSVGLCGAIGLGMPDQAARARSTRGGDASGWAISGAPGSVILPDFTATGFAITVSQVGNRSLIAYSPTLRMFPDLAERWSISPDGRTYTFTLRAGIRWSDGVPITSQDFEYTVLAVSSPDTTSDKVNEVAEIVGAAARKSVTAGHRGAGLRQIA